MKKLLESLLKHYEDDKKEPGLRRVPDTYVHAENNSPGAAAV